MHASTQHARAYAYPDAPSVHLAPPTQASREDEEACSKLQADVQAFQEECARDLEAAEPVIAEAEAALNSLDKVRDRWRLHALRCLRARAWSLCDVQDTLHLMVWGEAREQVGPGGGAGAQRQVSHPLPP